jgi:hypothetical protein
MVSRPVFLVSSYHLGPTTNFYFSSTEVFFRYLRFCGMGHPLWREDSSVNYLYNCCWALSVLPLSGLAHFLLSRGFRFCRLSRLGALRCEYCNPSPHRALSHFGTSIGCQIFFSKVWVYIILRLTVSRPVCRGDSPPSVTREKFFSFLPFKLYLETCDFLITRRPLWR